jgi:Periplasmic copper-binding protein (NosD)
MRGSLCVLATAIGVAVLALVPTGASSHPERPTAFPVANGVPPREPIPAYRSRGPSNVVCKADSNRRVKQLFKNDKRLLKARLRTLKRCRFHDIQPAIDAAKSRYRILLMPGVYREMPSREQPTGAYHDGPCPNDYALTEGFTNTAPPPAGPRSNDPPVRPNRNFQVKCPNAKNLIEVVGDPRPETDDQHPMVPKCLQLCDLQIEGLGKDPEDVLIEGDRKKMDVLRVDRAWGIYLRNFAVEQGAFNNIDLVEVNGFRISKIVARYGQNYGVLSFTSVNGLYDHVTAYGNGDSGIYPGSTEKGCDIQPNAYGTCEQKGCQRYSIEIRDSDSYGNTLGYSGTAGNSTYVHDNRFHDNATGLSTDSFAQGHPGMPQECVKWEHNEIYSNNANFFTAERQDYCGKTPFPLRKRELVCPQFQTPVGTGVIIAGGNRDLLRGNAFYDNWRYGVLLFGVPASLRGDRDPAHQQDTSNGNRFVSNSMGRSPAGTSAPNGLDFAWDGQGAGNCWENNASMSGDAHQSDPAELPACPGSTVSSPPNPAFLAPLVPCAAWDPKKQPMPPGCDWFTTPQKPQ